MINAAISFNSSQNREYVVEFLTVGVALLSGKVTPCCFLIYNILGRNKL